METRTEVVEKFYRAHGIDEDIFNIVSYIDDVKTKGVFAVTENNPAALDISDGYFSTRNGDIPNAVVTYFEGIAIGQPRQGEFIVKPIRVLKVYDAKSWTEFTGIGVYEREDTAEKDLIEIAEYEEKRKICVAQGDQKGVKAIDEWIEYLRSEL